MTDAAAPRSYRPGQWFAIFGDHATVALPPSEKQRVAALWSLVDDGAGFDEVLDALIAGGLRDLPGFVLVSTTDGDTSVVIRGDARAWFRTGGETVEVAGSGATTWAERSVSGVTGLRIVVGDLAEDGTSLPIGNGLVRVSEVVAPAGTTFEEDGGDVATDAGPLPAAPDSAPPGPIGPEPALPPAPPAPPVGSPSGPPPPVVTPGEPPTEVVEPFTDHDGMTDAGHPAVHGPEQPEGGGVVSRPVATLVFSHGDRVDVDRAVMVGRAPEARRFTSGDQPRLVTVPSPAHEISATHLEVRPGSGADHGSAVVTDLGSTNGSVLVQPGLPPEDLKPGIAVQLIPGAILDLGDGLTIQVINP